MRRILASGCLVLVALAAGITVGSVVEPPSGLEIFASKCARCHGPGGEGTMDHPSRLEGDLAVSELAEIIRETMPEDEPGTLSADDSQAVASFIHDAFYSEIARARNQPARISLARLTVRQYRRAVSDLVGSFNEPPRWDGGRGLRGSYFKSREPNRDQERVARRVDPQVAFDFGTEAPVDGIEEPRRYSIRWAGSVLAPETGEYEFIVRTEHAARLWVNDGETPVIDAWVKSGTDNEYRASVYLVAGQLYPVRLDFSKAKLGVDDSDKEAKKKEKPPSPPASIALLWKRPRGEAEVIATRFLTPRRAPTSFVCSVAFPPDDRSYGWERGVAISEAWDEATTSAAIQAAGYVVEHLARLAGTRPNAPQRERQLKQFCERFAERAFRRPLDAELKQVYIDQQFADAEDADAAVRRMVLLVLKSPRFLFREIDGVDAFDAASRLSFGLWDSIPDAGLLAAARDNKLGTDDEIRAQSERMLGDTRARAKLRHFLLTWLTVDGEVDLAKDPEQFPGFDAAAVADLRTSLELFLDEVLWSRESDYRRLLLSDEVFVNARLAKIFAQRKSGENEFASVRLDDGKRAGVLTHPFIMARFSHRSETSPIHRGVFLARGILGQSLRPPPEAFTPLSPELHPDLTTRERVTLQTRDAACMSCHRIINPLGFALERFDAVGRYRDKDGQSPVDDAVEYQGGGEKIQLRGARELAEYLAASDECHAAFVEQLFHHLVQQPVQAYGPTTLDDLRRSFVENDFHIRRLAVEIMVASARTGRDTSEQADESAAGQ